MPNKICKSYRDKLWEAIKAMMTTENRYQPLSDRTLVSMLNDRELWSTVTMLNMIRNEQDFPSAIKRRRQYGKTKR